MAGLENQLIIFFLHCKFACSLWCRFLDGGGVSWCLLGSLMALVEAWKMVPSGGCGVVLWKLVLFSILLSVWRERNDRTFRGVSFSADDLLHMMTLRIAN